MQVKDIVASLGTVFATFDHRTQDSGNISFGISTATGRRLFVKTAGGPDPSPGGKTFDQRVELLRRSAALQQEIDHPALVPLVDVVEAEDGIALVFEWFDGELLRSPAERRDDPAEAHNRFKRIPSAEAAESLGRIIDLHVHLEKAGWVVGDFYDGCLMYDFTRADLRMMDFECYRRGAYVNDVGRLPGSTRFMAPEELERGALVDSRTTVFNLGRMLANFSSDAALAPVVRTATNPDPADRFQTVAELATALESARDSH